MQKACVCKFHITISLKLMKGDLFILFVALANKQKQTSEKIYLPVYTVINMYTYTSILLNVLRIKSFGVQWIPAQENKKNGNIIIWDILFERLWKAGIEWSIPYDTQRKIKHLYILKV